MKAIKKLIPHHTLLNNRGFAIIAALMALLILTAVGALVFTITTKDIRVATRVIGEKKAFSAAQAGIHGYVAHLYSLRDNPHVNYTFHKDKVQDYTVSKVTIDPDGDPASKYSIPTPNPTIAGVKEDCDPPYGYDESLFIGKSIQKNVVGENVNYKSNVTIDFGVCYGPMPKKEEG